MPHARKARPISDLRSTKAVLYARVSSKEQEKEGFSIPAQLKLLREYAAANGFAVAQEYVDVETAKQTGRTGVHHVSKVHCTSPTRRRANPVAGHLRPHRL